MSGPKALVVGISDYLSLPDLKWPVNDARAYSDLLAMHGYSPASVQVLLDGQATKEAIRNTLIAMATQARPGEILFFAYGGHGAQVTDLDGDEYDRKDEAICPYEAQLMNPGSLLLDDELRAIIELNRGAFWVLFLGSSHSGEGSRNLDMEFLSSFEEGNQQGATRSGELEEFFGQKPDSQVSPEQPATASQQSAEPPAPPTEETRGGGFFDLEGGAVGAKALNYQVAVFSACKSFQIAWGEERSLFVEHLVNGYARGALGPGRSTYADVAGYMNRRLALMSFFGRTGLVAGLAPFGAIQIQVNGVPIRQDPNVEVPIPMKRFPFLGGVIPRELAPDLFEPKAVPDPIEINAQ